MFIKILRVWVGFLSLTGFELKKCLKLAIFHQFLTLGFKLSIFLGFIEFGFGNFSNFSGSGKNLWFGSGFQVWVNPIHH